MGGREGRAGCAAAKIEGLPEGMHSLASLLELKRSRSIDQRLWGGRGRVWVVRRDAETEVRERPDRPSVLDRDEGGRDQPKRTLRSECRKL